MTIESHSRGSGTNHKGRRENSKKNQIWRWLSDEEYEREKAEIEVRLKVLMELLQKEEEDQRVWFSCEKKFEVG